MSALGTDALGGERALELAFTARDARWRKQHNLDGEHTDITAESVTVDGDVSIDGDLVVTGSQTVGGKVIGVWNPVTFAAGNFTGDGTMTWTLTSGDQVTFAYMWISEHAMRIAWTLVTTSVGGTPAGALRIALPEGVTGARRMGTAFSFSDNGTTGTGVAQISAAGDAFIELFKNLAGTAWTASANLTQAQGQLDIEVQ